MNEFAGSFWPTERQELLLRAALLDGERAITAWRSLRPELDLDEPEFAEQRLLPLVYRQLDRNGIDDPDLPRLRGIYRRTWYVNQLLLDRTKRALEAVQEADADPLLVSSWELPALHYADLGLRAVGRLHLLVRPELVSRAARALSEAGWSGPLDPSESFLRSRHNAVYESQNGDACAVYWRLFHEYTEPGRIDAEDLWEPAADFVLGDVPARALCGADELLNVLIAGARVNPWPSLSWIADALAVLRSPDAAVDWGRLVRQARRLRATLRVHDAASFLRRELDAEVPDEVLEELGTTPLRSREVLAHRIAARAWGPFGAPDTVIRFLRLTAGANLPRALGDLPTFLCDEWGLDRRSQIPAATARRAGAMVVDAARRAKQRRDQHAERALRAHRARTSAPQA
jgi:Uncharacterised nucleotidyltransferase